MSRKLNAVSEKVAASRVVGRGDNGLFPARHTRRKRGSHNRLAKRDSIVAAPSSRYGKYGCASRVSITLSAFCLIHVLTTKVDDSGSRRHARATTSYRAGWPFARTCVMCDREFVSTCGACQSVCYCTPKCERRDWNLHWQLCNSFTESSSKHPPEGQHRLAICF